MGGRPDRFFASVLSFGWVLPASIAAGAGIGWLLDRFFHTFPVLTALLGGAGFAAGVRQLAREAARLGEPETEGKPSEVEKGPGVRKEPPSSPPGPSDGPR